MTAGFYDSPILPDRHPRLVVWIRWFLDAGFSLPAIADLFECDEHDLAMVVEPC